MDAAAHVTALMALDEARVAASVEEEDDLLLTAKPLAHCLHQRGGKDRADAWGGLSLEAPPHLAQVDHGHPGQPTPSHPLGQ